MAKVYSIFSEDWIKAGAKVDVDRFLKKNKINLNLDLGILDFADYIGLEVFYYDYRSNDVAGSIHSDENVILINSIYEDDYAKQVRIASHLLGMYFFANDEIYKSKFNFKDEDLKKLQEIGVDMKKILNSGVVNHTIYSSDIEEAREGDPELYFFAKELMSRDYSAKALDRSF